MSTKHIRTTADLVRFRASVRIDCASCGSARTLDAQALVQACGLLPLPTAQARLRCARCGAKGARMAVLPPI